MFIDLSLVKSLKKNKMVEVIHKGKIPTREEATRYGNSVLDVLRRVPGRVWFWLAVVVICAVLVFSL